VDKAEIHQRKFWIERTKKGHPALWERGGGHRNTGYSTIITDGHGKPKQPIYIRNRGELANREHALFIVEVGDHIIQANHHRHDYEIAVFRITKIETNYVIIEKVNGFEMGEWDSEPQGDLAEAVAAAMEKAECYHCRSPHYYMYEDDED